MIIEHDDVYIVTSDKMTRLENFVIQKKKKLIQGVAD